MRGKKSLILASIVCLAVILTAIPFIAACPQPTPTTTPPTTTPGPTPTGPIKIGAIVPLTGIFALWGEAWVPAFQVAFEEVNYEVAGRKIEFIIEDEGQFDTSAMLEKAKKLVEGDKVDVLLGPFFGGGGPAVMPYTSSVPIVNIKWSEPLTLPEELGCQYAFWIAPTYADETYPLGLYAYDEMGIRTVTSLGIDEASARDILGGFLDAFKSKGGQVVQEQLCSTDDKDFSPYLIKLVEADAFANGVLSPQNKLLLFPQYEDLGLWEKIPEMLVVEPAGGLPPVLWPQIGDRLIGLVWPQVYIPTANNPENLKFLPAYRAKYTEGDPDNLTAYAYNSVKVLLAALEATGGDTDPDVLKQALLKVDMQLPTGHFKFNPGRVGIMDNHIVQLQKIDDQYQLVVLKTYPQWETIAETYP